ncbi:hypothetical protein INR49_032692 [Caranx melampygus]|nr:hypothetical protein INR49_032692 [Caranx melampygus]
MTTFKKELPKNTIHVIEIVLNGLFKRARGALSGLVPLLSRLAVQVLRRHLSRQVRRQFVLGVVVVVPQREGGKAPLSRGGLSQTPHGQSVES